MQVHLRAARTSSAIEAASTRSSEEPVSSASPRAQVRAASDLVLQLARLLTPADRSLVEGVYDRGMSVAALARAANVHPRVLQRRLNHIMDRLASSAFRQVVARSTCWPDRRRRIATAVFIHGLTLRAAASELQLSLHTVRRELERIRGMLDERAINDPVQPRTNRHTSNNHHA